MPNDKKSERRKEVDRQVKKLQKSNPKLGGLSKAMVKIKRATEKKDD